MNYQKCLALFCSFAVVIAGIPASGAKAQESSGFPGIAATDHEEPIDPEYNVPWRSEYSVLKKNMTEAELGEDAINCIGHIEFLTIIGRVDWATFYNDPAMDASGLERSYFETNCLDREFEKLDYALNVTYRSVLKPLSHSERSKLRADQRRWLLKRRKICNLAMDDEAVYLKSWTCRQIVNYDRLIFLRNYLPKK